MSLHTLHLSDPNRAVAAWRAWRSRRAEERERVRTMKIISELPRDLRADIGWPARYYAEHEND